jgi:hypothetical protein
LARITVEEAEKSQNEGFFDETLSAVEQKAYAYDILMGMVE